MLSQLSSVKCTKIKMGKKENATHVHACACSPGGIVSNVREDQQYNTRCSKRKWIRQPVIIMNMYLCATYTAANVLIAKSGALQ